MTLLRAIAFNIYFFCITTIFCIGGLPLRVAFRSKIFVLARTWAGTVIWGARRICGIRVVVTGLEHLPADGAALLASQHQSAFDTLIWMNLVPAPSYVVKQELTRIPMFGPLLAPAGMIPVDRNAGATALRGLLHSTRKAKLEGRQMIIFPEGTRLAPGERAPLQPGIAAIATHLDMPVFPVATDSGLRWGRRAFMKYPGDIHIVIGRPIEAGTSRAQLLATVEAFWRDTESRHFKPGDNSVDGSDSALPSTVNRAS